MAPNYPPRRENAVKLGSANLVSREFSNRHLLRTEFYRTEETWIGPYFANEIPYFSESASAKRKLAMVDRATAVSRAGFTADNNDDIDLDSRPFSK